MSVNVLASAFLCIIVAALIFTGLFSLYKRSSKAVWEVLKKGFLAGVRLRVGTAVAATVVLAVMIVVYQYTFEQEATVIITLNFPEASKGQNANGTRFNMSEILCDEVLERAIEKGALEDITVNDLAACLEVVPTVQGSSASESTYHISTEFAVTFRKNKETRKMDSEKVVQLVADAYKEFYIDHYADNFSALNIKIDPAEDFAEDDYLDIATKLQDIASVISNYMYSLGDINRSFTSSEGESFYELAAQASDIRTVQIEDNLEAYLLQNGVSKDKEDYIGRLEYNNMLNLFEEQRDSSAYRIRNEAVEMYSEEMTRVVLVPTWDDTGEYYMGRTKVGIDTLSTEAESYSQSAAEILTEIETNNKIIESLKASPKEGTDEKTEEMIRNISESLVSLASRAKNAAQEYSEARLNLCTSSKVIEDSIVKIFLMAAFWAVLFYLSLNIFLTSVVEERHGSVRTKDQISEES